MISIGASITSVAAFARASAPPPVSGLVAPFSDDFSTPGTLDGRTGWTYTPGSPTGAGTVRANLQAIGGVAKMSASTTATQDHPFHDVGQMAQRLEIDLNLTTDPSSVRKFAMRTGTTTDYIQFEMSSNVAVNIRTRAAGTLTFVSSMGDNIPVNDIATYAIEVSAPDGSGKSTIEVFRNGYPFGFSQRPSGRGGTVASVTNASVDTKCGMLGILTATTTLAEAFRCNPIPLTGDVTKGFYALDPATGLATIPMSGIYYGTLTGVRYELRSVADGTVSQAITDYSSQVIGAGAWSGVAHAPIGLHRFVNSFANEPAQKGYGTPFAVGDIIAGIGQSEIALFTTQETGTDAPLPVNPLAWTFTSGGAGTVNNWRQLAGRSTDNILAAGIIANMVSVATGRPIGTVGDGQGAVSMKELKTGGLAWVPFQTKLKNSTPDGAWPKIKMLCILQGYNNIDGGTLSSALAWSTDFDIVVPQMRDLFGQPNLPIMQELTHTLPTSDPDPTDNETSGRNNAANIVRRAQIGKHNPANNIFLASSPLGLEMVGGGNDHLDANGLREKARRWGYSILRWVYGTQTWDGRGPLPVSATRSGSTVRIALDMNGATALTGANATGFVVSPNADMSSPLTVTSVNPINVSGTWYVDVLTSAALGAGTLYVASHLGVNYDESSKISGTGYPTMVYGAVADIPLFPAHVPIAVS